MSQGTWYDVLGQDWSGTWCWTTGADTEELLLISNIFSEIGEPCSRLRGLSKEIMSRCHKGNKVSLMLVDCCVHKTSLREIRCLSNVYTLSIENVDFVDDSGEPILIGPILRSLANNGQVKCLHVDSCLFDGNSWSYDKAVQIAHFLSSTPLVSIHLTGSNTFA